MRLRSKRLIYLLLLCTPGCTAAFDTNPVIPASAEISALTPGECADLSANHMMSDDAPVKCERLRRVTFPFVDFAGQREAGEVVVLDALAPRVQMIFTTLYERKFPLNKAWPLQRYQGDDDASMADNNTSAFNGRPITGGSAWSMHAYGAAIDINPRQNPYISFAAQGAATVLPASAAMEAVNRLNDRPGKSIRRGMAEEVIDIFANNGFLQWGGYWNFPIDYQHFEIGSRAFTEELARSSPEDAQRLFEQSVSAYVDCMAESAQASSSKTHEAVRAACVAWVMR
ncbi:M15 family metallopeptidase [Paraburkholderia hayleyella]|uniref:M15 family metallopeptidase n=1 Tax=Paraburkholderia hayleyella TaxID=2152889 RepID=UPI001291C181|nr:M15 family metallopeptidase [Paraburkholderia hayleyella]